MKAAVWHGKRDIRVEEAPDPRPAGSGEALIEVAFCGICGTDLHEYTDGPQYIPLQPHSLTHESAPINLGLLGYFKYWDAVVVRLAMWFPMAARWLHPHGLELPPGISFYTFESLSFVIDVYRREIVPPKVPRNPRRRGFRKSSLLSTIAPGRPSAGR